jgi:hypothetical protein
MRAIWLPLLILASCPKPSDQVPLAADFELAPGKPVRVAGTTLSLTLVSVLNDSRCPANVQCVWAGSADVTLRASGAGTDSTVLLKPEAPEASVRVGSHLIELRQISPRPVVGAARDPGAYRVTLKVTTP